MQPVSLTNLPEGLSDVVDALQALENSSEERNWELIRKAGPPDLYKFWSSSMSTHVEFAEHIKEYLDLPKEQKISLFMKNYPVFGWLPYVYKAYVMDLEGIPLGDGSYLPSKEEEYSHLAPEWRNLYGKVGSRLVAEIVKKMKEMSLTREEYLLLRAITLLSSDESLPSSSRAAIGAANSSLRAAIQLNRTGNFMADVDELLRKLGDIGKFEKDQLVNLAPNRQEEILIIVGATCAF